MGSKPQTKEHAFSLQKLLRTPALVSLFLGFSSLIVYLWGIGNPSQLFYDEPQYVMSARALLAHQPNPNPEAPPLGKLLIAAGIETFGDNPVGWRAPSAVCGALTIVAVFLWTYLLLSDSGLALFAAALAFFSNFTFVMSRIAMMDASLVAFLVWSLVAYTAALRLNVSATKRRILICCAGILAGLGAACKWNAVDTLAAMLFLSLVVPLLTKTWTQPAQSPSQSNASKYAQSLEEIGIPSVVLALTVFPLISYSLTYWPLCRSLHLPFGIHQLVEMNRYIWKFHRAVISNRTLISAWYTWPVKISPQRGLSYLLGNPVVMWGGLVALAACIWRLRKSWEMPEALVAVLYAANLAQWAVTPQNGILYYYYYPAAMILCVAFAIALQHAPERILGVRVKLLLLLSAGAFFLWCLPRMAHLGAPWDCALGCWS